MAQVRSWRTELIEAHRDLFHPPEGHPESAADPSRCEEGWSDLLARLCEHLKAALREDETIRIIQVKEKFATLKVYWRGDVTPETATRLHAIALGEARSACTCERCGTEGRLCSDGGVYMTRCATHGALVTVQPGKENVHLVRVPTSDGYRIAARRYDRKADHFVDDDPDNSGIEEA